MTSRVPCRVWWVRALVGVREGGGAVNCATPVHTNFDHYVLCGARRWYMPALTSKSGWAPVFFFFFFPRRRNVTLYCWKWKEDRCPASERRWRSAITSRTRQKRGRIQFGEKCITLCRKKTGGVVALVLVTQCECRALITTATSRTFQVQLWCRFVVLWPEIRSLSRRRSTLRLAKLNRQAPRCPSTAEGSAHRPIITSHLIWSTSSNARR